ncbi:MAG: molybdopterin molybdochelatase, partial [Anaerolineales bacterium]|nr:molybdopterin molybdochelatase [Anaerolineales bacterium]
MPEFFTVIPPHEALARLFAHLPSAPHSETISIAEALDRVTFEAIRAPASLPAFPRSTMD